MDRTDAARGARVERAAYLIAVVTLIVAGALLRSVVLNWIVGPGLVVLVVAAVHAVAARREVPS